MAVAIYAEGKTHAMAVGLTTMSTADMYARCVSELEETRDMWKTMQGVRDRETRGRRRDTGESGRERGSAGGRSWIERGRERGRVREEEGHEAETLCCSKKINKGIGVELISHIGDGLYANDKTD